MSSAAQKQLLEAARRTLDSIKNDPIGKAKLKSAIRAVEAEQQLAESFPNLVKEKTQNG